MRTISKNCFSCGTDCMVWLSNNCDKCWKQSKYKGNDEYTKFICSIDRDIQGQLGYGLQEINQKSYEITQKLNCPYLQEHRPKRMISKKQEKEIISLF